MTITYPCSFVEAATHSLEEMLPWIPPRSLKKVKSLSDGTLTNVKVKLMRLHDENIYQLADPLWEEIMGSSQSQSTHCVPKQICVVKQFPKAIMDATAGIESPRNEFHAALAIKKLGLPHVAEFLFAAQDEDNFYIASEHCPNGDLFTAIDTAGCFKNEAVLKEVLSQILQGVHSLHRNGVAHRDLSLENIVVDANGDLRIIDFAQAVMVGASEAILLVSEEHGLPGKEKYRGPELVSSGSYLATKLDSFAIGVICYALVTGQYPNHAELFPLEDAGLSRCTRLSLQLQRANIQFMQQFSPCCLDLMEQLMAPNPDLRLSVEEALNHPWLIETISVPLPTDEAEYKHDDNDDGATDSTVDYPCSDDVSIGDCADYEV